MNNEEVEPVEGDYNTGDKKIDINLEITKQEENGKEKVISILASADQHAKKKCSTLHELGIIDDVEGCVKNEKIWLEELEKNL